MKTTWFGKSNHLKHSNSAAGSERLSPRYSVALSLVSFSLVSRHKHREKRTQGQMRSKTIICLNLCGKCLNLHSAHCVHIKSRRPHVEIAQTNRCTFAAACDVCKRPRKTLCQFQMEAQQAQVMHANFIENLQCLQQLRNYTMKRATNEYIISMEHEYIIQINWQRSMTFKFMCNQTHKLHFCIKCASKNFGVICPRRSSSHDIC